MYGCVCMCARGCDMHTQHSGKISRKIWIDVCINCFPIHTCSASLSRSLFDYFSLCPFRSFFFLLLLNTNQRTHHITSHISHSNNNNVREITHIHAHAHTYILKWSINWTSRIFARSMLGAVLCFSWIKNFPLPNFHHEMWERKRMLRMISI